MITQKPLVIWDFDGVLCDSLFECMTVARVATFQLDNPDINITPENLHQICSPDVVRKFYDRLGPLRPFIVRGQDYLWQHYHFDTLGPVFERFSDYQWRFGAVFNDEIDRVYEKVFYQSRKLVASIMGDQYFRLFKPYSAALYAFRSSLVRCETYICTARDQQGVQLLFGDNAIEFPADRIFSKDFNGREPNQGTSKTGQVLSVLKNNGGVDREFLIIEDQVKAPAELKRHCKNMRVVCANYGYGLRTDWDDADLQKLVFASTPAELIYEIYQR